MLMCLGLFVFSLETVAYTELQRRTSWRHGQGARIGARAAAQFLGPGEDRFSLPGVIAPGQIGDPQSLAELRSMADAGDAYQLVSGAGEVLGAYVIENLDERQEHFLTDGTARKIEFTLELRRVDDGDAQDAGLADGSSMAAELW